jgi:hypothetical protein
MVTPDLTYPTRKRVTWLRIPLSPPSIDLIDFNLHGVHKTLIRVFEDT